jgi:hypothetical protein
MIKAKVKEIQLALTTKTARASAIKIYTPNKSKVQCTFNQFMHGRRRRLIYSCCTWSARATSAQQAAAKSRRQPAVGGCIHFSCAPIDISQVNRANAKTDLYQLIDEQTQDASAGRQARVCVMKSATVK